MIKYIISLISAIHAIEAATPITLTNLSQLSAANAPGTNVLLYLVQVTTNGVTPVYSARKFTPSFSNLESITGTDIATAAELAAASNVLKFATSIGLTNLSGTLLLQLAAGTNVVLTTNGNTITLNTPAINFATAVGLTNSANVLLLQLAAGTNVVLTTNGNVITLNNSGISSPGGATTQLQFNNSAVLDGASGIVTDASETNLLVSGASKANTLVGTNGVSGDNFTGTGLSADSILLLPNDANTKMFGMQAYDTATSNSIVVGPDNGFSGVLYFNAVAVSGTNYLYLTNVVIGANLSLSGNVLSGTSTNDNWVASGTTNSTLAGNSLQNAVVATNGVTVANNQWYMGLDNAGASSNLWKINGSNYMEFATPIYRDANNLYLDHKAWLTLYRQFITAGTGGADRDSVAYFQYQTRSAGTVSEGRTGLMIQSGDRSDVVNKVISGAANNGSGLIRITTSTAHGFLTGEKVHVYGIVGTTEANNNPWTVTVIDTTNFDLQGSAFVNAYVSGGTASNRGLFYGVSSFVAPRLARGGLLGNSQFGDDVSAYTAGNNSSVVGAKGTDAYYLYHNPAFSESEWGSSITLDAWSDWGILMTGHYNYGIDLSRTTVTNYAVYLKNNQTIAGQNAAASTGVIMMKVNSSDEVEIPSTWRASVLGTIAADVKIGATTPYSTTGTIRMGNATSVKARKADNLADITLVEIDASNVVYVGAGSATTGLKTGAVTALLATGAGVYPGANNTYELGNGSFVWKKIQATFEVGSITSPAQITGDQNNYNPGGQGEFIRLSTDASRNITGLTFTTTQVTGEKHLIINVGAQNIVLVNQSASSTSANRFLNTTGADITLSANQEAKLWYDGTTGFWRVSKMN